MILGALFEEWLKKWDKKLEAQKRKVLLFVDNCPAHPKITTLKNITLQFFLPNATAEIQVNIKILHNLMPFLADGSGHYSELESALPSSRASSPNCSH